MKRLSLAALVITAACNAPPQTGGTGGGTAMEPDAVDVTQDLTADTTWHSGKTYTLKQLIYVMGGTLTIEPGTTILGDRTSALIVTRDGRLHAEGTREKPIVFTSSAPEGSRDTENWGGLVLNGRARINVTGGENNSEGVADEPRNKYGGTDDTHECGVLKYVRVEFAGRPLTMDNELNGITLNGCGSKTLLDFVQVHRGKDDGIELFGGTANLKHIVLTGSDDDGLDWDQGWSGKVQFLVVQQLAGYGNHGIEADNNRTNHDLLPRSAPTLYNVTLVGRNPDTTPSEGPSRGIIFREGTAGVLANAIVTNFTSAGLIVDKASTAGQWSSGALKVQNSIFWNNPNVGWQNFMLMPDNGFDEADALSAVALANRQVDPQLTAPTAAVPSWAPKSGSPALSGAATPPDDGFFDPAATFVGAVGADDWTSGWTVMPNN
ncbi:MAG: hypothetical protein IPJ65_20255 [Archangiaceae bacterium]|nr:hypothetical protein [Archangiaceae bacterium]